MTRAKTVMVLCAAVALTGANVVIIPEDLE